jgi:hypothetical protein
MPGPPNPNPNVAPATPPLNSPPLLGWGGQAKPGSGGPAAPEDWETAHFSIPWAQFFTKISAGLGGSLPLSGGGITFGFTSPQIDGSLLGANSHAPLQIKGSNTVDGRVILTPGAVSVALGSSASSVYTQAQVQNQPAVIVQDYSGGSGSTDALIQIFDNAGGVKFSISGGGISVGTGSGPWGMFLQGIIQFGSLVSGGIGGPLIDATHAPSPLQLNGPTSLDGRIILVPGPVAASAGADNSSVFTQAQVVNQPAVIIQDFATGGGGTNNLFAILNNAGAVEFAVAGGGVAAPQTFSVFFGGQPQFSQGTTGAGAAALGANCPAVTPGAPNTWLKFLGPGGIQVYVPAWK